MRNVYTEGQHYYPQVLKYGMPKLTFVSLVLSNPVTDGFMTIFLNGGNITRQHNTQCSNNKMTQGIPICQENN